MTTSIFDTRHYKYPQNFLEMKPKLSRLEQAIKKLEANLIDTAEPTNLKLLKSLINITEPPYINKEKKNTNK